MVAAAHDGYALPVRRAAARALFVLAGTLLALAATGAEATRSGQAEPTTPPVYAFIGDRPSFRTSLARVIPRTLRPAGKRLRLDVPYYPLYSRSPDGNFVAIAAFDRPLVRVVDLSELEFVRTIRLGGVSTSVRLLAWLSDNRLVAVIQRMSRHRRYVRERRAVFIDPTSGRIVARRPLSKLALGGHAAGARLVLTLRRSTRAGSTVKLVILEAGGRIRARRIEVGRTSGALNVTAVTAEPSGRRAFIVGWAAGRATPVVIEVDLEALTVTRRRLRIERSGSLPPAAFSGLSVIPIDDRRIAAIGAISASRRIGGERGPAAGIFLIDTRTWRARLLDPRAVYLQLHDGGLLTYGPSTRRLESSRRSGRGSGITAYNVVGRRLYHLYGNRAFSDIEVAGDYGHILLGPPRTRRLVFDLRGGRRLGMLPALRDPIEVLR
jgi:hypothetical protein